MVDTVLLAGYLVTVGPALIAVVKMPRGQLGTGRHVSRPLGRLVGGRGIVLLIQLLVAFNIVVWSFTSARHHIVVRVLVLGFNLWLLDDYLTGGDKPPRRRRGWARVKIRMPAPIRLRPVERWVPAPSALSGILLPRD